MFAGGSCADGALVSIVVPAYVATPRQAALLDETLRSVDAQSYKNYEVLVVDDGSPLDVTAVVEAHPLTRSLRRPNGGSAQARNTGIAASRGRFLVFLDADDHLLPAALEAGLGAFVEHPDSGFVVGRREEMTFDGVPVPWGIAALPRHRQLYATLLAFDWYIIPPSSAMFRREVVEQVGGFRDPWGADDLDFYLRVAQKHLAWCHEDVPVTRYRRYSTSTSRDGERMLASIRAVYARQWPEVAGNAELEAAHRRGLAQLVPIFTDCLAENLRDRVSARQWGRASRSAALLARESPRRLAVEVVRAVRAKWNVVHGGATTR